MGGIPFEESQSWPCAYWASIAPATSQTPQYGYQVVHVYPHDHNAFTQGLEFRAVIFSTRAPDWKASPHCAK